MSLNPSLRTLFAAGAIAGAASAQDADESIQPPAPGVYAPSVPFSPSMLLVSNSVRTVYCSIAAEPTSDVPGYPGVKFTGTSTAFDRPFGTKNGRWIIRADTGAATTQDAFLMLNGAVAVREGDQAPWGALGDTIGPFEVRNGLTEDGTFAFKNNTTAVTNDDYVIKVSGGIYTVMAQEAQQIGAMAAGVTYDDILTSVILLDNGDVCLEADGIDGTGITTTTDEVFVREGTLDALDAQELVTIPTGQFTGSSETWDNIDFEDVWVTPDGAHILIKGDLAGVSTTTDNVVTFDNAVVLQEGFDIPGGPYVGDPIDTSTGFVEVGMDLAGNWWADGNNETETDWVVRNGVVMAKAGDPIHIGSTELWDDATYAALFFMHQGDSQGNYVIAGVTDAVDILANAVIVLNNTTVVARENDPIDLDNNGLFDDSAFINTFSDHDVVLNDLGELIFVCSIRATQGAATAVGQAVIKMQIVAGPDSYCTAGTTTNNCVPAIGAAGFPSASAGSDFTITIDNVEGAKQGLIFYGVTGPVALPWGLGSSFLCVKAPTQRTPAQDSGGTAGQCDGSMTLDFNAYIATHPTAVGVPFSPGDTCWAQGWFRDPPSPKTTNLSDGLKFTVGP